MNFFDFTKFKKITENSQTQAGSADLIWSKGEEELVLHVRLHYATRRFDDEWRLVVGIKVEVVRGFGDETSADVHLLVLLLRQEVARHRGEVRLQQVPREGHLDVSVFVGTSGELVGWLESFIKFKIQEKSTFLVNTVNPRSLVL